MSDSPGDPDPIQRILQELIDRYGPNRLAAHFAEAMNEAARGSVAGPGIEDATDWLDSVVGDQIAGVVRLSGEGTLVAEGSATGGVAYNLAFDEAVMMTDEVVHALHQSGPENLEVLAAVGNTFWQVVAAWGVVTQTPPELIPFALAMALAIAIVRVRRRRSDSQ